MKKTVAAVALAAGVAATTAGCGGHNYAQSSTYCVNEMTGQVMAPQYCQSGYSGYNPSMYDYWVGSTYGTRYRTGVVIQHNYFVSGRQVNPSNTAARKAAGIPVSGSVSNGAKATSTPAKAQKAPFSGSTSKAGSTIPKSTTKSTGGFSGGRSSSSSSHSSSSHSSSHR